MKQPAPPSLSQHTCTRATWVLYVTGYGYLPRAERWPRDTPSCWDMAGRVALAVSANEEDESADVSRLQTRKPTKKHVCKRCRFVCRHNILHHVCRHDATCLQTRGSCDTFVDSSTHLQTCSAHLQTRTRRDEFPNKLTYEICNLIAVIADSADRSIPVESLRTLTVTSGYRTLHSSRRS